jgi:tetratricopeptide (TPR) repeat protein
MEQVDKIRDPEHVDLILLSGGINDVEVDKILDPSNSSNDIITGYADIEDPMYNVLIKLLNKCDNSKIVVTSYYPIVSEDTPTTALNDFTKFLVLNDPDWGHKAGAALLILSPLTTAGDLTPIALNSIRENSNTFDGNSRGSIGRAVDRANLYSQSHFNAERVSFAPVNFPPERSYGTSTSWLWRLIDTKNGGKTDDHRYDYRISLCDGTHNLFCNWDDKIVAIGHPNVEGAREYERAIKSVIEIRGLEWLDSILPTVQLFQVIPTNLAVGEPLTVDYTVADNGGSGLTQVELWRKNETRDWQEIVPKRNILSGENGPLSGSFTDSPPAPGKYWYGVHVVDNAGNWNDERNSNTNYQPVSFEPIEVEVIQTSTTQCSMACDSAEAESWFERGVAFYDQFEYTEAVECFDEATKICPQYEEAWEKMGDAYLYGSFIFAIFFSDNNPRDAIRCYDEALNINPENANVWNSKGVAYVDLGQYDKAIQCYDEALNIDPQFSAAWYGKGFSQYEQGNFDDALQSVEMAIALNPEIPDYWQEKGDILTALGSDEAQAAFNKAEELKKIHKPIRETEGAVQYD